MNKPTFDHTALHALDTRFVPDEAVAELTEEQIAAGKAAVARQEHGWFETPANAEPLHLTLEQAMRAASRVDRALVPELGGWSVYAVVAPGLHTRLHRLRLTDTWREAAECALGRPVVAVEDAAFLEAELFAMEQRAKLAENGEGLARAQIERLRGEKTGGDQ